jgi:hypothetical protein
MVVATAQIALAARAGFGVCVYGPAEAYDVGIPLPAKVPRSRAIRGVRKPMSRSEATRSARSTSTQPSLYRGHRGCLWIFGSEGFQDRTEET